MAVPVAILPLLPALAPHRAHAEAVPAGSEVDEFLAAVPVYLVTDRTGAPVLAEEEGEKELIGRIFFDKGSGDAALERLSKANLGLGQLEVRQVWLNEVFLPLVVGGDPTQLGGRLTLQPLDREVRNARQIRAVAGGAWTEPPGAVPLFVCAELTMQGGSGIPDFVPVFLREADLKAVLRKAGSPDAAYALTTLQLITAKIGKGYQPGSPKFRLLASQDARTASRT